MFPLWSPPFSPRPNLLFCRWRCCAMSSPLGLSPSGFGRFYFLFRFFKAYAVGCPFEPAGWRFLDLRLVAVFKPFPFSFFFRPTMSPFPRTVPMPPLNPATSHSFAPRATVSLRLPVADFCFRLFLDGNLAFFVSPRDFLPSGWLHIGL